MPPLMPAPKLRPVRPEDHHVAARHVLAAVVSDAFHDRVGAAVAHAESLAGDALEVRLARRRAVEHHVPDDHVLGRIEGRPGGHAHDDLRAAQSPCRRSRWRRPRSRRSDAARAECAQALAGASLEPHPDRVLGKTLLAVAGARPRSRGSRPACDPCCGSACAISTRSPRSSAGTRHAQQLLIEHVLELARERLTLAVADRMRNVRPVEELREVEPGLLPVVLRLADVEHLDVPDHVVDGPEAELRHQLAQLPRRSRADTGRRCRACPRSACAASGPASRCPPDRCSGDTRASGCSRAPRAERSRSRTRRRRAAPRSRRRGPS